MLHLSQLTSSRAAASKVTRSEAPFQLASGDGALGNLPTFRPPPGPPARQPG